MMPRRRFIAASAAGTVLGASAKAFGQAGQTGSSSLKEGYAPVNGLKLYYEIHGDPSSRPFPWSCCTAGWAQSK